MVIMEFLNDYMIPVIVGICLMVGYIVKHWIKDVDNKIIPTLCAILGIVVALWMNWGSVTPEVVLSGLTSGLASTGLHQAFTQLINKK
jgi:Na+/glutamate symporter